MSKTKDVNVKLQVVNLDDYNDPYRTSTSNGIHYKAATAYAVKITNSLRGWSYEGQPMFKSLEVRHMGYHIADFNSGRFSGIADMATGDVYAALRYMEVAVTNARQLIVSWGNEWLSPTEIEDEMNIRAGTVRQYINRNRDWLLRDGLIKESDGRTVLMKRGKALNIWDTNRHMTDIFQHTEEYHRIVDFNRDLHSHYLLPIRQEVYNAVKDSSWWKSYVKLDENKKPLFRMDARNFRAAQKLAKWLKENAPNVMGDS